MNAAGPLRVLVVAGRQPWPLNSGSRLHLYHVLRELAQRADVTLALAAAPASTTHLPAGVRVVSVRDEAGPRGDLPDQFDFRENKTMRELSSHVSRLARRHYGPRDALGTWLYRAADRGSFDVIMLNGAVFGQLAPFCRLPFVWNPQDELVLHTLRGMQWRDWRRTTRSLYGLLLYAAYERWVARQAAATIFVSPIDAAYARRWAGAAHIEVVPNGVDLEYFAPDGTTPTPGTLAFVGSLEFPPNIDAICWFTEHVWPRLHSLGHARRLLIAGRNPVPAVRALSARPGVELASDVPDVRPYLRQAAVVVVPTRQGGGLKNKILEACAMRRAVVASRRAIGGLTARPGRDLLVADGVTDWVAQINSLLASPARADRLAAQGHDWVRRAHRWSQTGQRFHEILRRAATTAPYATGTAADRQTATDHLVAASQRQGLPCHCRH